jgi:hypothetical protein
MDILLAQYIIANSIAFDHSIFILKKKKDIYYKDLSI